MQAARGGINYINNLPVITCRSKRYMVTRGISRTASLITCSEDDRKILERRAASRTEPRQVVERARMILGCVAGERVKQIAQRCQTRPNTVIKWRQRFSRQGLAGLEDAPRLGAKRVYARRFAIECWRPWKRHRRQACLAGTAGRWRRQSMVRFMRFGGCCARRAFACSVSVRGA